MTSQYRPTTPLGHYFASMGAAPEFVRDNDRIAKKGERLVAAWLAGAWASSQERSRRSLRSFLVHRRRP